MKGTPTQLTCRGALHGYPSMLITNIFILVQDVSLLTFEHRSLNKDRLIWILILRNIY